jgi:hypothetical protein
VPTEGTASLRNSVRARSFCGERGAHAAGSRHPAAVRLDAAQALRSTIRKGASMIASSAFDGH